jgi:hypothetical protein
VDNKKVIHRFAQVFDFVSAVRENGDMTSSSGTTPAGEVLAAIDRALNEVNPQRTELPPQTRLEWLRLARKVQGRVEALTGLLTAEADRAQASVQTLGTPLTSWLGMDENLSRREAAGAVLRARTLAARPLVGRAATEGQINPNQAHAIGRVLGELAPQLNVDQQNRAEEVMVELATRMDSQELANSAARVLAEVAPAESNALQAQHLERAAAAAQRQRSLRFFHDGASVRFDGSLPRLEGESLIALVTAHSEALRRTALEARDPAAYSTAEQRRADAFISLITAAQHAKPSPGVGDTRVIVKLDYDLLKAEAAGSAVTATGEPLSAGELRRACCDAEILPVVLGSASEVLDVGRSRRLVTGGLKAALTQRDGGCVFPGCDVLPVSCEAHHIEPWWTGASTALSNLVLLCHHHHGLLEPAKSGARDQWEVRMALDELPELLPPQRMDPQRRPIRHRRLGGTGRLAASTLNKGPASSRRAPARETPDHQMTPASRNGPPLCA